MRLPPFHRGPVQNGADYSSEAGAEQLARMIEQAWHARGYPEVKAWSERVNLGPRVKHGAAFYAVRSNLISGLPPPAP
jgi:hypothetical protein